MTTPNFLGVADPYGVPAEGVVEQVDSITLNHATPAALSKAGVTSYPGLETAQATPTADVITVYDVTTSKVLVLNTDYTLTASGTRPETITYSVTRISASTNSADGDTARVTYRYGMQPDMNYQLGEFQGEPGAAPMGTAFEASDAATTGSTTAGIGEQAAGGSLTDPAAGTQSSSETGSPGSEYAVKETEPGAFGYPLGAPDTNPVYGGDLPENFVPVNTGYSGTLDTVAAGGSDVVPSMYSDAPGYRPPSSGVAATVKDTTLTDILGNAINANPLQTDSSYAATNVDTSYIGAPAAPTPLLSQTDTFTADQPSQPDYLSQQGIIPSTIVVENTTTTTPMVLNTDYTLTVAGNGPNTVAYITPETGSAFAAGNSITVSYSYGDPTYWDSHPPASVPGAPTLTSATAVNRGAEVTWQAPAGTVPIDYYLLEAGDLGTMYVPVTGQPVDYGQPAPSGGAMAGQPAYQADTLTLEAAAIAAPAAPAPTQTITGGIVAAGTYKVAVTYVNANGETVASASGTVVTTTGASTIVIPSPAASAGATGWYAYVSQAGGSVLTRQQAAGVPSAIGTGLTLIAPPTSTGAVPQTLNTTLATLSRSGILTPPNALIVRDITSAGQSILTSGEIAGGEADPMQADGQVLEYGYDYTVTVTGTGPWVQYQITLAGGSVNAEAGDQIIVEYWWGADPSSVSAIFTQGIVPNTPVIYKPDGTTPYSQGYQFRVAAANRIGVGPYSAWSSFVVPLNYNEAQPGSEGSINVGTGALDPANAINPIYRPDGTVKSGTGLGG
jgi:hypothetical protein